MRGKRSNASSASNTFNASNTRAQVQGSNVPGASSRATRRLRVLRPSRLSARSRLILCAGLAAAFVAFLLAIPVFAPFDADATQLSLALQAPGSSGFVLGSDSLGRDVLLRTLSGGYESVVMSFSIVAISLLVGVLVGLAAGFFGGAVDYVLDKVITMFQAFPSFVLAIAIAAILGQGMANMVIALSAVYWTQFARLSRSLALSLRGSDSVRAALVCGANSLQVCLHHLLPAILAPLAVMAALAIGDTVLTMAGLSFLGLGPERPTNEWGAMMSEARTTLQIAPWQILVPGTALFATVTLFNCLGDALRDFLDENGRDTNPE